ARNAEPAATAPAGASTSSGLFPKNVLQSISKAADSLQLYKPTNQVFDGTPTLHRSAHTPDYSFTNPTDPPPPTDTEAARRQEDVNQLDKAEQLAQDAYRIMGNPNSNYVDKQHALDEMQQADQIRHSVEGHLDPLQQKSLDHINAEEQDAI